MGHSSNKRVQPNMLILINKQNAFAHLKRQILVFSIASLSSQNRYNFFFLQILSYPYSVLKGLYK